jgi:hypothetical protein
MELSITKLTSLPGPQGTDVVYINVPVANKYQITQTSENGVINPVLSELSGASVVAVNAVAGGNLACCFQLGAPSAIAQYTGVRVVSAMLVLAGVPSSTSDLLLMAEAFPFDVQVGDTALVEAGCDRLIGTCKTKFDNVINFRGEPYVPGMDQIIQRGRGG